MKKVAVVTGASSGIGEATVRKFLDDGYEVYAAARESSCSSTAFCPIACRTR